MTDQATFVEPCQPRSAKTPPKGANWIHEPKWDGYRCIIVKDGKNVRLYSRNRTDWTGRLPVIGGYFQGYPCKSAVFDTELCICDAEGRPDFRTLHAQMRARKPEEGKLSIYAFDLLHLDGADLRPIPLVERKKRLDELAERKPNVVPCLYLVQHFYDGERLLKLCKPYGLEGIVSKRGDRPYTSGESKDWLKVKNPEWKERNAERWRLFEGQKGKRLH